MIMTKPTRPLAKGYKPTAGRPHHVRDVDTWWSLAKASGVDPMWLVQYNFETRKPSEVNWYLSTRVGCHRPTKDGKNLRFSASAKPGIVYLPPPAAHGAFVSRDYRKYGIIITGEKFYRMRVRFTLDFLVRSKTGKILLEAIGRTGKTVEISAWTGATCNATASAEDDQAATAAGVPSLMGGNSFEMQKEGSAIRSLLGLPEEAVIGTGAGSDATVRFSPSMFGHGATGPCAGLAGSPGSSPSQVLFHELAHAYRNMHGGRNLRPTIGGSVHYTNLEEFFAVVLTNILIADPTYPIATRTLRAGHAGFTPLAPGFTTSRGFVSHVPHRNMMRELVASEPELARALAGTDSTFNPFAEKL